jgi:mRNA-degrading endonuclease RelE of RelBE toxin-antitoxin system
MPAASPQVAISDDFLRAYAAIPKAQQKKVRAFVEKFKADPTQASIHYEPLYEMADSKVRTVRIGDDYRAVVVHPPQGDVFLCVWVDHHDEAMAWAQRKRFEVHSRTGSLQVWETQEVSEPKPTKKKAPSVPASADAVPAGRLLQGRTNDELMLFGVPEPLLPAVHALRVESDLDHLAAYLPREASDALYMLAAGYDLDTAIEELDRKAIADKSAPPIDTEDFSSALARPGSQQKFKVVDDPSVLSEMLDTPLEQWRIFLHPTQRKLVEMKTTGSACVLGGAGTGKTVVAMHRARFLARQPGFLEPGQRVLFTTFTRNLAEDISRSLDLLCGAERDRIEVRNLHAVATDLLARRGVKSRFLTEENENAVWDEALDPLGTLPFTPAFYRDEWELVVQAQNVTTEADYLRARRTGRGTPVTREQRKDIWKVLSAYRSKLDERGLVEFNDAVREAMFWLREKPSSVNYRAVVVDEAQDLRQADLDFIRALTPEAASDIFLVGDAHQRIYRHTASLSRSGIQVRGRRSRQLRINYRTTQGIRNWALALLKGIEVDDLDEGKDTGKGYHSLRAGSPPIVKHFKDADAEIKFIVDTLAGYAKAGNQAGDTCLVARTRKNTEHYKRALKERGIETHEIHRSAADHDKRDKLRVATMHRVKGLEFRNVIMAGVQHGQVPLSLGNKAADETAREAHVQSERRLVYVAATRARDELVITGFGRASEFL